MVRPGTEVDVGMDGPLGVDVPAGAAVSRTFVCLDRTAFAVGPLILDEAHPARGSSPIKVMSRARSTSRWRRCCITAILYRMFAGGQLAHVVVKDQGAVSAANSLPQLANRACAL